VERDEEARKNASQIERVIESLRYNHLDPNAANILYITQARYRYHDFWEHAREVNDRFKHTRPLKEDRERLTSLNFSDSMSRLEAALSSIGDA